MLDDIERAGFDTTKVDPEAEGAKLTPEQRTAAERIAAYEEENCGRARG